MTAFYVVGGILSAVAWGVMLKVLVLEPILVRREIRKRHEIWERDFQARLHQRDPEGRWV